MSEVKRYDISAFGGVSMDECRDGTYVNYEDYAALEAKCAALAAENAGLKAGVLHALEDMEAHHDDHGLFSYDADGEQMDALLRLCDAQDSIASLENAKTPDTDAFLAEVRAQGVDSAINRVIAMMNHQHPVTSKAIDIMRVHAYQLRKGEWKK